MNERYQQIDLVRDLFEHTFHSRKDFGKAGGVMGASDDVDGVQWNAFYDPESSEARLSVNLEGKEYDGWPVARFIERETEEPGLIIEVAPKIKDANEVIVTWARDAWQYGIRLLIDEGRIDGTPFALSEISCESWVEILEEAHGCLDAKRDYRGRTVQVVTLSVSRVREEKWVSPHLNVSTLLWLGALDSQQSAREAMSRGRERLAPIHEYVAHRSAL